jgi:hypothetical protein
MIENRELAAGTRLVARHKKQEHVCEVVETSEGLCYRVNGKDFNSPSSAGREVTGGVAVNGWRFWSLEGDLKPAKERKPKTAKAPAKKAVKPKGKKGKKVGKKVAKAASAGSYGCGACNQEFPTLKAATAHALEHTQS